MVTFKKKAILFLVGVLIVSTGVFCFFYWGNYSEGTRAGVVMKLSKRGVIIKTYEGQLNLQGFGATDVENDFSQVWEFSVECKRKDIIEELRKASVSGDRVELHYVQKYWQIPWRGDTQYFIREVRTDEEE